MTSLTIALGIKAAWRTDTPFRLDDSSGLAGGRAADNIAISTGTILSDGGDPGLPTSDAALVCVALRLREQLSPRPRLLAFSVGPRSIESMLREVVASGVDETLRVWPEDGDNSAALTLDGSVETTRIRAALAAEALRPLAAQGALLVLVSDASPDEGHGAFGAMVAHALGFPLAHRAAALDPAPGGWATGWRAQVKLERGYIQQLDVAPSAVVALSMQGSNLPEASWPAWLSSRTKVIPRIAPRMPDGLTIPKAVTTVRPPLPRVKRYTVPGANLNAEQRIRELVGTKTQGSGAILPESEGADRQAQALLALLQQRGYLPLR